MNKMREKKKIKEQITERKGEEEKRRKEKEKERRDANSG